MPVTKRQLINFALSPRSTRWHAFLEGSRQSICGAVWDVEGEVGVQWLNQYRRPNALCINCQDTARFLITTLRVYLLDEEVARE